MENRTWGYDFYTPTQPLIAHDYTPGKHQKKWNHDATELSKSRARLQTILRQDGSDQSEEMHKSIEKKYDIGDKRTLEQYAQFCGIDIMHQKELFSWCQDYKWVPYTMTDAEIKEIRAFGNPHHQRKQAFDRNKKNDVRGSIKKQYVNNNEEIFYNEIVGEVEHFKDSSWIGKMIHILMFVAFLMFFALCVWKLLINKNGAKYFSDIKQS